MLLEMKDLRKCTIFIFCLICRVDYTRETNTPFKYFAYFLIRKGVHFEMKSFAEPYNLAEGIKETFLMPFYSYKS